MTWIVSPLNSPIRDFELLNIFSTKAATKNQFDSQQAMAFHWLSKPPSDEHQNSLAFQPGSGGSHINLLPERKRQKPKPAPEK